MTHSVLTFLWVYRRTLLIFLVPLILLPLPLVPGTKEASCGFVILVMAIYWITEALPLAVTALIPVILFPMMGILTAKEVSVLYLKDTNWLMIGGLIIAVAVETTGLHKRLALRVLTIMGVKPRWLMLGFMSVTFFLSMWISNTATTAMLIPIAEAIIKELYNPDGKKKKRPKGKSKKSDGATVEGEQCYTNQAMDFDDIKEYDSPDFEKEETTSKHDVSDDSPNGAVQTDDSTENNLAEDSLPEVETSVKIDDDNGTCQASTKRTDLIIKGITICVPYAASIGGTATLTGTVPNLVLSGQYEVLFPEATPPLSFGIWITYCLPQALLMLILAYIWLSCWFIGFDMRDMFRCCSKKARKTEAEMKAAAVIQSEYDKLGKIKWDEVTVVFVFATTAVLWFFRSPGFMPGWSVIFQSGYVSDGTVAIFMAFTLFIFPQEKPSFMRNLCGSKQYSVKEDQSGEFRSVPAVLDWKTTQRKFPWDVVLLLGSGFAVADAATKSGLSLWFGEQLAVLKGIDDWVVCLIVTAFICLMTETTSNTATTTLFVPILAELAKTLEIHPLYLLIPPVIAASLAFMLPVATPPNAIAFSYGRIAVWDLVKAGWVVNILGVLTITFFINTYGIAFFNLREFPDWANTTAEETVQTMAPTAIPCLYTTT